MKSSNSTFQSKLSTHINPENKSVQSALQIGRLKGKLPCEFLECSK